MMMRILALGTSGIVRPFIHHAMVEAFRAHGIRLLNLPIPHTQAHLKTLTDLLRKGRFEAVFTLDLGADDLFIGHLREIQAFSKTPFIIWFVDDPEGYGFPGVCEPDWTLAFCWDRQIVDQWYSPDGVALFHLPLATDPSVFYPESLEGQHSPAGGVFVGSTCHVNPLFEQTAIRSPGFLHDLDTLWNHYKLDFRLSLQDLTWLFASRKAGEPLETIQSDPLWRLWVHSCLYKAGIRKRQKVVSRVLGERGSVYGDDAWRHVLAAEVYRGKLTYGEEVRKVYNKSAFILETRQPQARTGLTQRIFDGAACGIPVLAEFSPELDLFEPKREFLYFSNLEEGVEKRRRYLLFPHEARKIGEKARHQVLAQHTYIHRARQILDTFRRLF